MKKVILLLSILVVSSCSSSKSEDNNLFKGYFIYLADAALFTDCEDNKRYPVVQQGDYLKLETEYLKIVSDGGKKVFITFEGEIIEKDRVEGEGKRKFIVVKKLDGLFSDKSCD
jgi:copper homeostasis protein (lipoprotein)